MVLLHEKNLGSHLWTLKINKDNKFNPDSNKVGQICNLAGKWLPHWIKSMFDNIHFLWHLGPYIFVTYIFGDVPHIWKPIYTSGLYLEFYLIFPDYISSSAGLVTITLTCGSNNEKKSVKIPEEATMYCKSKKDAANKVKIICYIHCHILIIIPSLNTSLPCWHNYTSLIIYSVEGNKWVFV